MDRRFFHSCDGCVRKQRPLCKLEIVNVNVEKNIYCIKRQKARNTKLYFNEISLIETEIRTNKEQGFGYLPQLNLDDSILFSINVRFQGENDDWEKNT